MTALELVQEAFVKKVARRAGSEFIAGQTTRAPAVEYDVTVVIPGRGEVRLSASSATAWRRVVKKAQLKLTSKAARAAAAGLRERIAAAVAAEKGNPEAAVLDARTMERARKGERRRKDQAAAELRRQRLSAMKGLMADTRISREELLELWGSSVVSDVMGS